MFYDYHRKSIIAFALMFVTLAVFIGCQDNANNAITSSQQDVGSLELLSFPPTICEDPVFVSIDGPVAGHKVSVISVANDTENLYVKIRGANGYNISNSWVYAGDCSTIPSSHTDFPYSFTHVTIEDQELYIYTIPLAGLGTDICISVNADVVADAGTDVASTNFNYTVVDCGTPPPPGDCGPCESQITQLTLSYDGDIANAHIVVFGKKGKKAPVLFDGIVQPGEEFTFRGQNNHDMMGPEITIDVNSSRNTEIHTSCSQPIGPGLVKGDFTVIEGYSHGGGLLCSL